MSKRVKLPSVTFMTRVRDESIEGPNPYRWEKVTTEDLFANKKCVVFSLPGAFTPTCSTYQLPNYDKMFEEFKAKGIDDIYCVSVNDSFVMNAWFRTQNVMNVKPIPDGNGEFTEKMGFLVEKFNLGFGKRSWRYAMIVENMELVQLFEEPGIEDNVENDPYKHSSPENVLKNL